MTIDTNILIAYVGGEELVIEKIIEWRRENRPLFISSVSVCEILAYPKLTASEEARIESFLQENFITIPFDGFRARRAAYVRRTVPSLKLPDAAIAAVAEETGTPVVTRNVRDFRRVKGSLVITI